jgi:peptidase M28-like protein/PA domain-containing protein
MKKFLALLVLVTAGVCASLNAQDRAPSNDLITKQALKADLYFLASDDLQGRLTNTLGNRIAADWITQRFERMGLLPGGPDGSFYQHYDLMVETLGPVDRNTMSLTPAGAGGPQTLKYGADFYPQRFSATTSVTGDVVFAGFGIASSQVAYDDYGSVVSQTSPAVNSPVRGKIALVIDHEPGERDPASPFDGLVTADASSSQRKAQAAQDHGAIGILFVSDVHNHDPAAPVGARGATGAQGATGAGATGAAGASFDNAARNAWPATAPRIDRFTLAKWVGDIHIPAMQISTAVAESLVQGSGKTLAELSAASETAHGITPVPLKSRIEMSAAVDRQSIPDRNVLGIVEGSDPQVKDETVIVCAHYDHDGADGTRIFNGADDDGSGIVALIEIAEAYVQAAKAGHRPRRTVLFAAWNSEERGLLGAWAYTVAPTRPLNKTVAVLNMDMLGRNEEVPPEGGPRFRGLQPQTAESNNNAVNIIGTSRSADMKAAADKANAATHLDLRYRYDNNISQLMRRSDHWPFLNNGVPGVWFHTGLHPDYHTPQDRPERINYDKMEKIARMIHQMSWDLANQNGRPKLAGRATSEM